MENKEEVLEKIGELRAVITSHIEEQRLFFDFARIVINELGDDKKVRERRLFVEALMEREKEKAELRRAIIKHGTIVAAMSCLYFLSRSVWKEMLEVLRVGIFK